MKAMIWKAAVPLFVLLMAGCSVEKTEEGKVEAPNVEVTGGEVEPPKFDVDPAKVEVGTEEKTVTVPDVNVTPADGERK